MKDEKKDLRDAVGWFTPERVARAIAPLKSLFSTVFGPEAALSSIPLAILRMFYGNELTLRLRGKPFTVNLRDTIISFEILVYRKWQPLETALYERLVRPGDNVIDVGANIGYFSVLFAELTGPSGRVLAIEPEPENVRILAKNIAARGLSKHVSIAQTAAGARSGEASLYKASSGNLGDNRMYFTPERHGIAPSKEREVTRVPVRCVDDLVADWTHVDFIKMDIQGFEAQAFAGMPRLLDANPDLLLFTELFPFGMRAAGSDPRLFLNELRRYGFEMWETSATGSPLRLIASADDARFLARIEPARGEANVICARGETAIERVRALSE